MVQAIETINRAFERMRTGIPGLDDILGGGFLHGNSLLVQGTPGSGKSSLGLQIIANGALLFQEPGIVLSFEPFPQQLYRDALSFGWDFRSLELRGLLRIIFVRRDDLYSSFAEKESAAMTLITDAALDLRARRVLVDSTSNFWRLPLSRDEQQKIFYEFVMKLKGLELSPILTADLPSAGAEHSPEEMYVDSIIALNHTRGAHPGARRVRTIEIVKARGQQVVEGRHPFHITPDGLRVSPYIHLSAAEQQPPEQLHARCSTGVSDLDDLLDGGFKSGSTTMVAGMSGTGKTTLAAHFVGAGLAAGQNAVFVTLHESSSQLIRNMEERGLGFVQAVEDQRLSVLHASGSSLQLIEFYYQLRELIEATNARRVVIDGVRDFLAAADDEHERNYYVSLFGELLFSKGISGLFTWRVDDVAGLSSLANIRHAELMDNIVYLGLLELEGKLRKMIALVKSRGEYIDASLRELIITPAEVRISSVFSGLSGVLYGSASGHLSEAGREIVKPLMHIRDFVNNAAVETPEQAQFVLGNLRSEFEVLAQKLTKHFDLSDMQF